MIRLLKQETRGHIYRGPSQWDMSSSYLCWEMLEDEREIDVFQGKKGLFMLVLLIHRGESADLAE